MSSTLLKSLVIDGVQVDIKVSNEKEPKEIATQFIYELLNFDND